MKIHEIIGDNRIKFASRFNEMSEELNSLSKEVDKNRKTVGSPNFPSFSSTLTIFSFRQTKELASRYERSLQESEVTLEKHKTRFDITGEELQRFLISKEGESSKDALMSTGTSAGRMGNKRAIGKAVAKGGMLLKGRNPANVRIKLFKCFCFSCRTIICAN